MDSLTNSETRTTPNIFTKGMTLSDYMAGLALDEGWEERDPCDEK
jgi:hypothetical protein